MCAEHFEEWERDGNVEGVEPLDGQLKIRCHEQRMLLHRLVKYVREDRAETPGKTRLARLTAQVLDYLNRTADPRDILRGRPDPDRNEASGETTENTETKP